MKNNFYLIANFARSFDIFHYNSNKPHLVSSIFYTEDLNREKLENLPLEEDRNLNIIYIKDSDINNLSLTKPRDHINIIEIPKIYLLKEILNSDENNEIDPKLLNKLRGQKVFKEIIDSLLSDYQNLDKIKNINLNQYFFIFENLNWFTVQLIFKNLNIVLSGGTLNKRHIVSTTNFNLIKFLISLDFKDKDIYNSFSHFYKYESSKEINLNKNQILNMDKALMLKIIKDLNNLISSEVNTDLNTTKKEINTLTQNVNNLEQEKLEFKNKKIQLNKNLKDSKKLISLDKSIESLNTRIKALEETLLNFENLIKYFYNREEVISKLNFDELRELYIEDYLNLRTNHLKKKIKESFQTNHKKINKIKNPTPNYSNLRRFSSWTSLLKKNILNINNIQERKFSTSKLNLNIESSNSKFFTDKKFNLNDINSRNLFLNYLDEIIKDAHLDPIGSQNKLETKWTEYYLEKSNSFEKTSKYNFKTVINKSLETLNLKNKTKTFKKKFPLFYDKITKDHLIISYSIITTFYEKLGFTAIAFKLANDILFNIYAEEWKTNIKDKYIPFQMFLSAKGINDITKLNLGNFFIEIFCSKPTNLFERVYKETDSLDNLEFSENDLAKLVVNEEYLDFINKNFILYNHSLPMLCKPNLWNEKEYGGFLDNKEKMNSVITGSIHQNHSVESKDELYKSINKLNSVKLKINNELLTYLESEGLYILNYYFKNKIKDQTDYNQNLITLKLANSYSKYKNPIYISCNADWRGRIYTQSFYLSYQGGDLSSSLINLFEGNSLNESGLNYFYIYGANCHNENDLSKESFDSRINWVKTNYDKIINLNKDLILKADNLFLFTSFCLNMKKIHEDKNTKIYMPIYLDATCSGIQHVSSLILDLDSGKKVNLTSQTKDQKVGDIYTELLKPINLAINQKGIENPEKYPEFRHIKLKRKNIKTPIMTKIYNVTVIGIADQLRNSFEKVKINNNTYYKVPSSNGSVIISYLDTFEIAQIINNEIFKNLPSLKTVYDYFKSIVKICLMFSIPISWFTPSGVKITQSYTRSIQNKVSISFKNKTKSVILREFTGIIDNKKQAQAIIPNIIHSLDASHLMNILNSKELVNYPILTIHDCFGSHPNNIKLLKNIVILEFINLYANESFLLLFHQRIIQNFKDNQFEFFEDETKQLVIVNPNNKKKIKKVYFPELPKLGKLNLKDILKSEYIIT